MTPVSVTLPDDANDQPTVQVRVITTNASGNDEWVGIDDIQANGGMLTLEDFADYADHGVREFDEPLVATYRGYTFHGIPKTSGCVTTFEALNILEQFDPAEVVRVLSEERISFATIVPAMIQACLLGVPDVAERRYEQLRTIYYGVLVAFSLWAVIALRLATPFQLFKALANMAGLVLAIAGVQVFLVNRRFLPRALRPSLWREGALLLCSAFYAFFAWAALRDVLRSLLR